MEGFNDDFYVGEECEKRLAEYLDENGINTMDDIKAETDTSGTYNNSPRKMFFPRSFDPKVRKYMLESYPNCQNSNCISKTEEEKRDLTLDHIIPVSQYFNDEGYLKTKEERAAWYNDINNLKVLCRKCNSTKSGVRYDPKKVMRALGIK